MSGEDTSHRFEPSTRRSGAVMSLRSCTPSCPAIGEKACRAVARVARIEIRCRRARGLHRPIDVLERSVRARSTGREASMTMHHYWRFRDGKIGYFRGSEDTEQTAQLFD